MVSSARFERARSAKLLLAWLLTLLIVGIYFSLPDGEEPAGATGQASVEQPPSGRIEVLGVTPAEATPGSAVTVQFAGASQPRSVQAYLGKAPLPILSRRDDALVVRLPAGIAPGHIKLRVADLAERSKPYDLRVKPENWRKPFRSVVGGLALLIFGISVLGRGAREAVGLRSTHVLARWAARGPAALAMGIGLGTLTQSTTAAASVLSGLSSSSLLALGPAAAAFLGAELGAATAPLLSGMFDPREGLLLVALGVMWMSFAANRRGRALSRLVLGVGLIAFGLQTLRPGFEPFVQAPTLLSLVNTLRADSVGAMIGCALLGAALVAIFQGPGPVCVLVLVLAQTTAQWDLRTALSVLSGAGLGGAVGAIFTFVASRRARKLLLLNLMLGAASTALSLLSVDLFAHVADLLVPGVPHELHWGKHVLLPNLGLHLGVAFSLSQLACALLVLPASFPLARTVERWFPQDAPLKLPNVGDAVGVTLARLLDVAATQLAALEPLRGLAVDGDRDAGRRAEQVIGNAQALLDELVAGPVLVLDDSPRAQALRSATLTCVQLQRSLEGLERQAERFIDARVALSPNGRPRELAARDLAALDEMHLNLKAAGEALLEALGKRQPIDLEAARASEIAMNAIEARLRKATLGERASAQDGPSDAQAVRGHLAVLKLADAYEAAGNQLYRLSDALAEESAREVEVGARSKTDLMAPVSRH